MILRDLAVPDPQGWQNVADAIFHNARRRPAHAAIVDGARTITYADLAVLVAKTAGHLETIGVRPGELVGVALGDNADHVVALLAIAWLGAAILPMDVRWTAQEKHRIAAHFGARLVLVPDGDAPLSEIETVALTQAWHRSVAAHGGNGGFVRRREQPLLLSLSSSVPYVLAVRNGLGVSDVKGLIEKAKIDAKITYASPGAGTVGHLAAKQFEAMAGINLTTVPYRGLAPALKDIVGGHVDLIFDTAGTSLPLHRAKQVSIIATGSSERWSGLPDVPTIAESGLAGFRAVTWYAIVAPPATPAAIADKISKDVADVVKDPATAEIIRSKLQMDPIGSSGAEAAKLFADETKLWAKVIKDANVSLD